MRQLNSVTVNSATVNSGTGVASCAASTRIGGRKGRIIVASSSAQERRDLRAALEYEGHATAEAETAAQVLEETSSGLHRLLVLSSGLEGAEPHALCRAVRSKSDLGILVLAGHGDTRQSRIDALNAGADDYLPSPTVLRELPARVRAVLRRVTSADVEGRQIILQDRAIDFDSYKIRGPGNRVSHLTPKESLVLQCLTAHANKAFTHRSLAQTVWQRDGDGEIEYLRAVIRQLRRKLEPEPDNPRYILTERSVGYRFHMPPRRQHSRVDRSDSPAMAR